MPGALYLAGDDVTLRTVEEEDLAFINETINIREVRLGMTMAGPAPMTATESHFEENISDDGSVNLLICVDEDEPAGMIILFDVDDRRGKAEIGIWVAPDYQGNGYGTEAAALVVDHAFQQRRLHRVLARVLTTNDASARIWENLWFTHEGTLRESEFLDGEHVGMRYFGLLEDEWDGFDSWQNQDS
ncbi:GNAT family N-acetyltransferase [Haloarchaeobius sp. DYHT-AS-18]|uniref:GNAT family N-acetyltransferase n=1 Tax=Haloarchaeobius sp. DYHT-AS-18 TaxID=3446117 RepID=UPI003EB89ED3